MNSLMDVQNSTRADTILVTSPVPWLLLDIQSKETSLPLHTLKVNRMLLARMYNVKQKATTAVLCRRVKLRSAQELCDFLTKNFSRPAVSSFPSRQKSVQLKRRVFFNLPSSGALSVSRNREGGRFCTVKGIRQLHSVRTGSEQLKVFTRERARYCHDCLAERYNRCENTEWVDDWKEVKLAREPSGSTTRATEDVTTTEQLVQLADLAAKDSIVVVAAEDDSH